ncbi:unnamed protein product, partial [Polarella glacialis]
MTAAASDDEDDPLGIFRDESPPSRAEADDRPRERRVVPPPPRRRAELKPCGDGPAVHGRGSSPERWPGPRAGYNSLPPWPPPPDAPDNGKFWARDSAGRLFRKPFKPSEADLESMRDLDRRIESFIGHNGLADKVARIIHNMMPYDVETLMGQGVDLIQCRSPTAVVISRIRRIETA